LSLPCAVAARAEEVTLLVEHPGAAELYRTVYAENRLLLTPRVVSGNLRRSLARDPQRYDRIQVEAWGPSVPGMASLNQEHLLTVEAFGEYLRHLEPRGVLILSRKLLLPPSDMLKVFAAAYRGLQEEGIPNPSPHIVVLRGWDSYTLLVSPSPFSRSSLEDLRVFCRQANFDLVFYDEIQESEANRFNVFAEAIHFRQIQELQRALQEDRGQAYFGGYYLDLAPARDDRPFHSRFTRWSRLGALFRSTGSRFYTLFLSGETIVAVVLLIAAVLGLLLLLLPRLFSRSRVHAAAAVVYFLAAGAGFMFIEMAFLQQYTFVFGNPVIAFTVVLAELLVLSGIGGAVSARWTRRILLPTLAAAVLCGVVLFVLFRGAGQLLLRASAPMQALGSFALLAPVALLMGVPFPVGLRLLVPSARTRAFGWGANGVASVLASILAIPLTMSWGIRTLLLLGAICYSLMLATLLFRD
jgi:hypothetical protein